MKFLVLTTASTNGPDDDGSKHLRNVRHLIREYTAQHATSQSLPLNRLFVDGKGVRIRQNAIAVSLKTLCWLAVDSVRQTTDNHVGENRR